MSLNANLDPKTPEEYAHLAEIYAQEKQWQLAIENYHYAIALKPNFSWYHYHLAQALSQQMKWDEAIISYRRAIDLNHNFSWSHYNLGNALTNLQRRDEAIVAYNRAIKIDANFPWSYYNLANVLMELQRWDEAIFNYLYIVKVSSDLPGVYSKLGDAIEQIYNSNSQTINNDHLLTIQSLEKYPIYHKLREFFRKNPELSLQLADGLDKSNKVDGAIIFYHLALEINQKNPEIELKLKQLLDKKNQLEKEIVELRNKIKVNPNRGYYYNLGVALTRQQRWGEAVTAYHQAIEIDPDFCWWFYHNIWEAFTKENKLETICSFFQSFLEKNPHSFWSYLNLGEALTRLGKVQEAVPLYQNACRQQTQKNYPDFVQQTDNIKEVKAPNFMIIGVNKGGTTSLYSYLIQHPQIIPPVKKEMDFWSWKFNGSIDWYLAHFPAIPEGKIFLTGEASPSYFDHPNAAARIAQVFPKIKLIILLRNPIDRAVSQYHQWLRLNWENRTFEEVIKSDLEKLTISPKSINYWRQELNYLARGVYVEFFQEWMGLFPREQFLVLKSEDFYANPEASMQQVLKFLDLPEYQLSEYKNYNTGNYSPIDKSMRKNLKDYFQVHNHRLEEYLGMKFDWD
ncbi:MAG: tetratricopeptide repeat protein [Microcoleaceae cyanobacterium MO_207.B10]|nr:tetratricopeptide repeat protein [Microcoleaceae cyanobacterium MO_207.B10]